MIAVRFFKFTVVATSLTLVALNLWITPPFVQSRLAVLRWPLLALLGVAGFAAQIGVRRRLAIPVGTGLFLMFLLIAILSTAWSVAPAYTLGRAASVALLLVCGCIAGGGAIALDGGQTFLGHLARLHIALLIAAAVMLVGPLAGGAWDGGFFRGPFGNPNGYASALVITWPAVVVRVEDERRKKQRRLTKARHLIWLIGIFGCFPFVVATGSRAGLVALIAMLAIFVHRMARRRVLPVVLLGVVAAGVLISVPSESARLAAMEFAYKAEADVLSSRRESLATTLEMAGKNPMMGSGFGTSADSMPYERWDPRSGSSTGVAREKTNAYLGLVEEVGLAGAVPLVLSLLIVGGRGIVRLLRGGHSASLEIALTMIVVAGLVHVNAEAWLTSAGSLEAYWFWLATGTLGVLIKQRVPLQHRRALAWTGTARSSALLRPRPG